MINKVVIPYQFKPESDSENGDIIYYTRMHLQYTSSSEVACDDKSFSAIVIVRTTNNMHYSALHRILHLNSQLANNKTYLQARIQKCQIVQEKSELNDSFDY